MKEFQDYELAHHTELTRATSIVTYILAYNGGVMPEEQNQLNAVIEKIPADVKKSYLSGSMEGVVRFNTKELEMSSMNNHKLQIEKDISFLHPQTGITLEHAGSFY